MLPTLAVYVSRSSFDILGNKIKSTLLDVYLLKYDLTMTIPQLMM
jgi:hypothetical protein